MKEYQREILGLIVQMITQYKLLLISIKKKIIFQQIIKKNKI
jgi:hypothetical protein